ncbi:hypothetical protein K466DRAFT_622263 [Polyporus arcularius HHB13444]|uniref:Uncharacterized protein n=1 Tax=Polyporus arcularius HHB13444 TaxID=1314778 RepID=A0A5C3P943_9APHY|nr:hypothetical protein K466DRAFT_622263 [Polyporus arcularius HHB13444]
MKLALLPTCFIQVYHVASVTCHLNYLDFVGVVRVAGVVSLRGFLGLSSVSVYSDTSVSFYQSQPLGEDDHEVYIPSDVWEEIYDAGLYTGLPEPTTSRREAYRQWVRDHQPFVYLPKDYHAPRLTPSNYSVFPENKALLHYGIAFTYEEVIEYAIKTKRLQRENLEPSEALAHGYRAATAFVKNLSKQSGVHLELQFPLSLKYRYVAAVCNTNNMFTKPAKKERVTEMESMVMSRHYPRVYTGDAEGEEYDSDSEEAEEQEKNLEREGRSQGAL